MRYIVSSETAHPLVSRKGEREEGRMDRQAGRQAGMHACILCTQVWDVVPSDHFYVCEIIIQTSQPIGCLLAVLSDGLSCVPVPSTVQQANMSSASF